MDLDFAWFKLGLTHTKFAKKCLFHSPKKVLVKRKITYIFYHGQNKLPKIKLFAMKDSTNNVY